MGGHSLLSVRGFVNVDYLTFALSYLAASSKTQGYEAEHMTLSGFRIGANEEAGHSGHGEFVLSNVPLRNGQTSRRPLDHFFAED
jgi:hypothetical protein